MAGAVRQVEDYLGTTSAMRSAEAQRVGGYNKALGLLEGTRELGEQFTTFGQKRLGELSRILKDPEAIRETAGYEFRFGEGKRAVERSAISRGGLFSGQTLKELTRYGQEYATAERGIEIQRLSQLAQMGLTGGMQATGQVAGMHVARGEALAAGGERRALQTLKHAEGIAHASAEGYSAGSGGMGSMGGGTPGGGGGDVATGSSQYFGQSGQSYGGDNQFKFNMKDYSGSN